MNADDAIKELVENKAAIQEMFASKGWEIWLKWSDSTLSAMKDASVAAKTVEEREDARHKFNALFYFNQLPFFFQEQIEKASADSASLDS